jgi:hypothetical protein
MKKLVKEEIIDKAKKVYTEFREPINQRVDIVENSRSKYLCSYLYLFRGSINR